MLDLSASADFGLTGQYIARITGRAPKWTFARTFVGAKGGKRGEISTATVDEPGLYVEVDVGKKGKDETFYVYDGQEWDTVSRETAMVLAKSLDTVRGVEMQRLLTATIADELQTTNAESEKKALGDVITLPRAIGALARGQRVARADVIAERRKVVDALRAKLAPSVKAAFPAADEKAAAVARIRALMAELGVSLADLQ